MRMTHIEGLLYKIACEQNTMSKTIFNKDMKLTFGKYKGVTVEQLVKDNPEYLLWCHDNIEWFELPDKVLFEVEDLVDLKEEKSGAGIMLDYDGTMLLEPRPQITNNYGYANWHTSSDERDTGRCRCSPVGMDCTCGEDDYPSSR
jgi:hypothetical protein